MITEQEPQAAQPATKPLSVLHPVHRLRCRVYLGDGHGEIRVGVETYRARELRHYLGEYVWVSRESEHEIDVWSRKKGEYPDCYLICVAVSDSAPFFLRHRFGEVNQPGAWMFDGSASDGIEFYPHGGRLCAAIDYYVLENPEIGRSSSFDGDVWEEQKQHLAASECSHEAFRLLYRLARALRRGLTVTLAGDDPPHSVLSVNYWRPELRRLISNHATPQAGE